MTRQPDDATDESHEYENDPGIKSPNFVTRAVFDEISDENIHTVKFPDPEPYSRGDASILIRAVVCNEGGIVTYDDGVYGFRRLFLDPEEAVREFRETVERKHEECGGPIPEDTPEASRGSLPTPEYDPGFRSVEFDGVTVEVIE